MIKGRKSAWGRISNWVHLRQCRTGMQQLSVLARNSLALLLIGSIVMLPVPAAAFDKWPAHIDLEGKLGNERSLGDAVLFVPVLQGPDSMFFLDLRFQLDDDEAREGNFGLGYRQLLDGWIAGGYAFYDVRESQYDNTFRQVTLGAEALTERYDARVNVYLADEDKERINGVGGLSDIYYSGNYVLYQDAVEQSMSGVDFEVGGKLPGLAYPEVRGYVGGYYFDASDTEEITGPRGRVEVRFPDLLGVEGSLFEIGGEIRNDSERDTDYFFTARLRIPFGGTTTPPSSLTSLEKRMTERIERDPDVVVAKSGSSTGSPLTINAQPIELTHVDDAGAGGAGTFEDPFGTLTDASGVTSDIVLLHADSVFSGEGFALADNQRLLGESADMTHTINTDQLGTVALPRATAGIARPVIGNSGGFGVLAGSGSEVANLALQNNATGLAVSAAAGPIVFRDLDISGGATGIDLVDQTGPLAMERVSVTDATAANLRISGGDGGVDLIDSAFRQTATGTGSLLEVLGGHTGSVTLADDSSMIADAGASNGWLDFDNADGTYTFNGQVDLLGEDGVIIGNGSEGDLNFYAATIAPDQKGFQISNSGMAIEFAGTSSLFVDNNYALDVGNDSGSFHLGPDATITATGDTGTEKIYYGGSSGTYTFDGAVNFYDGGMAGLYINNAAGATFTFNDLTITDMDGSPVYLSNNDAATSIAINGPSAITQGWNAAALTVQGDQSTLTFADTTTITATNGSGLQFNDADGSYTFNGVVALDGTSTGGDTGIDVINDSAGTITFTNAVTITNPVGTGVNFDSSPGLLSFTGGGPLEITTAAGDGLNAANGGTVRVLGSDNFIAATGGAALNLNSVSTDLTFDTLASTDSTHSGLYLTGVIGAGTGGRALTVTGATTVTNAGADGIYIGGLAGGSSVQFSDVTVDGANGTGLVSQANSGSITATGPVSIEDATGYGVLVAGGTGNVNFDSTLDVTNAGADGIYVVNHAGNLTVAGKTTVDNATDIGLYISGGTGDKSFADVDVLNRNDVGILVSGTNGTVEFGDTLVDTPQPGVMADGVQVTGVTDTVTFDSLTINDSDGMGMVLISNTGNVTVTGPAVVSNSLGTGISVNGSSGDTTFNGLQITTNGAGADGLYVAGGTGTTRVLDPDGYTNFVNATGGAALNLNSAIVDLTFDTLASTNSTHSGLYLGNVTGTGTSPAGRALTVNGATTVTNAGADGIYIGGLTGGSSVQFSDVTVDGANGTGFVSQANSGSITATGPVSIEDTTGYGVLVAGGSGNVNFDSTLDVTNAGADGIYVVSHDGNLTVAGKTIVDNATDIGLYISGGNGDMSFADVDVLNRNSVGIIVTGTAGTVEFGDTLVDTPLSGAFDGVQVIGVTDTVTFDSLTINDSDGMGMLLIGNTGNVTVTGPTVVSNSAMTGILVSGSNGDTSFNGGLQITTNGAGADGLTVSGGAGTTRVIDPASYTNSIAATGGAALNINTANVDLTFDTLASTNSTHSGLVMNGVTGAGTSPSGRALTVNGSTTVTNAGADGIYIGGLTGGSSVQFNDVTVDGANGTGFVSQANAGSIAATGPVSIEDTTGYGVAVLGGTGGVSFEDTLDVARAGADGIYVVSHDGSFDVAGKTTVDDAAGVGLLLAGGSGSKSFADVDVLNRNSVGIVVTGTSGTVEFGDTLVDTPLSGTTDGVEVIGVTSTVTFDSLTINDSDAMGMLLASNSGNVTVTGPTVVSNSAMTGILVSGSNGDTSFNGGLQITTNGAGADGLSVAGGAGTVKVVDTALTDNFVNATGGAALNLNSAIVDLTFDTLTSTNSTGSGLVMNSVTGAPGATPVGRALTVNGATTVTNAANDGVLITSLASGSSVEFNTVTVDGTGTAGINLLSNAGSIRAIGAVSVEDTGTQGVFVAGGTGTVDFDSTLNVANAGSEGIYIASQDGNVTVAGKTTVNNATGTSLYISGGSGDMSFADVDVLNRNDVGILVTGTSGTVDFGATLVGTPLSSTADGVQITGVNDDVTFASLTINDSDGMGMFLAGNDGNVTVTGATVVSNSLGTGVSVNGSSGDTTFNGLQVTTNGPGADGLYVSGGSGTTRVNDPASNTNSIAAVGGAALNLINANVDLTFDTLASTSSTGNGVSLVGVTGMGTGNSALTVNGSTTVTNAGVNGVNINTLAGGSTVTFNDVTVNGAGQNGVELRDNGALSLVSFNGPVAIDNAAFDGLAQANNDGSIIFHDDLDINNSGEYGIYGFSNAGDLTVEGTTTVTNSTLFGIGLTFNDPGGDYTFADLVVDNAGAQGLLLNTNPGSFSAGTTTISNTVGPGLAVTGGTGSVTFTDTLAVSNTGGDGIDVILHDGSFSVAGKTTVTNSTGTGINLLLGTGSKSFADVDVIDRNGAGIVVSSNIGTVAFGDTLVDTPLSGTADGVQVTGALNTVTFDSLTVNDSAGRGLYLVTNSGNVTVTGPTVVSNSLDTGVYVNGSNGDTSFSGGLQITTTAGDGLYVAGGSGTTTVVDTVLTNNFIDATGGAALNLNSANVDLTFDTLASTASTASGLYLVSVTGMGTSPAGRALTVNGSTTVTNAAVDGIYIGNLAGGSSVQFNDVTVDGTGSGVGLSFNNNGGSITTTGAVSVENTGNTGVYVAGGGGSSSVNFDATLDVTDAGGEGIYIGAQNGNVTVSGKTTVDNAAWTGILVAGGSGNMSFADVDVLNRNNVGINVTLTSGTVAFGDTLVDTPLSGAFDGVQVTGVNNTVTFDNLTVNDSGDNGLYVADTTNPAGVVTVSGTTTVNSAAAAGVLVENNDAAVALGTVDIDITGAQGVAATDSAGVTITGGTIDNTVGDGIYALNSNLTVANLTIGGTGTIGADGIAVETSDALDHRVAISGTTLSNITDAGIDIDGSAGTGTLYITSLAGTTVTDAGGGGILVNTATFDADANSGNGYQQVAGGNTTIGSLVTTTDITGDGLSLDQVLGSIGFGTLNIGNDSGTGIYIRDAAGKGGSFAFATTGGSVNTTNGTALDIDPVALNMTLSSVTSSNATGSGILLDTVSGTANLGTVTVTNSGAAGVDVRNSTANVTLSSLTVNNSGAEGLSLTDNTGGLFRVTGTTNIDSAMGTGISVVGTAPGSYTGNVTLGTTNVTNRFAAGIDIDTVAGDLTFGRTTINGLGSGDPNEAALAIANTAAGSDIAFTQLSATGGSGRGVVLTDNAGNVQAGTGSVISGMLGGTAFSVDGGDGNVTYTGTIQNSLQGYLIDIGNRDGGTVLFNGSVSASAGGATRGIYIHDNSAGDITFNSQVIVAPSFGNEGVVIYDSLGTTSFNGGLTLITQGATALDVTGAGTLNITGSNNSVTAIGGENAISINGNDPLLANHGILLDATFRSVNGTNNTGHGIYLNDLLDGSSFTITGESLSTLRNSGQIAGSGIYVSNTSTTPDAVNISITNMDIRNPQNDGITLSNTNANVTLDDVNIFTPSSAGTPLDAATHTGTLTHVNSVLLGDSSTGLAVTSGNATTTIEDIITYNGLGSAITVDSGFTGLITFAAPVTVNSGTGFDFGGSSGDFTFQPSADVTMNGVALDINSNGGTYIFGGTVDVNNTAGDAVTIGGTQAVNFADLRIESAGGNGVTATAAGTLTITGGSIDDIGGDGINAVDTSLAVSSVDFGAVSGIGGDGINVSTSDANDHSVALNGVTFDNIGGTAVVIDGTGGTGTLTVTDFADLTVNAANSGGIYVERATFDAGGGAQVDGGTTVIGSLANRVSGDGIALYDVSGDLGYTQLDVFNDGGTGVLIDLKGLGTTFGFDTGGGTIDTTSGAALYLDPPTPMGLDLGVTLDDVSSVDSPDAGLVLDTVSGSFTVTGTVTVTNSANAGILINNSSANVTLGNVAVETTGGDGIELIDNTGTTIINGGTIDDTVDAGLSATNSSFTMDGVSIGAVSGTGGDGISTLVNNGTSVSFAVTNSVLDNIGGSGINIEAANSSNLTTGTITGTDISNTAGAGISAWAHGGATIGDLQIGDPAALAPAGTGLGDVNVASAGDSGIILKAGEMDGQIGVLSAAVNGVAVDAAAGNGIDLLAYGNGIGIYAVTNSLVENSAGDFHVLAEMASANVNDAPQLTAHLIANQLLASTLVGGFGGGSTNNSGTMSLYLADNNADTGAMGFAYGLQNVGGPSVLNLGATTGNSLIGTTLVGTDGGVLADEGNTTASAAPVVVVEPSSPVTVVDAATIPSP